MIKTSIGLVVFLVAAVFCGVVVVNTLTKPFDGNHYEAVFTDATGLVSGADVLIGGVRAGRVGDVRIDHGQAVVGFDVDPGQHIPADVRLAIRYADLLGGRVVTILPGPSGPQGLPALVPGTRVPVGRTQPAVDLTTLLGGFRPLFDAIDPAQVNQLTGEIIALFQGEGGTVQSLLTHTISVTQELVSRRAVLSSVLTNLNSLVDFSLTHRTDFQQLLGSLNTLVTGLAQDRGQIADAIDAGTTLAGTLSGAVDKIRPELRPLLDSLTGAATTFTHNSAAFTDAVGRAPALLDNLDRALDYGGWVNIYVCNLNLDTGPLGEIDLSGGPHSQVCR
ncbi:MCE family protein [Amycolatopsis sp. K13G38]|uniref:MCE family protein n=1 Tax=Amycolatopsis acididurans TaxID=2724524 RepID=A0ABX1J303_9PSEU|nr:MCE family protein [Amycolatopsis acididurans]NKQ52715.1 MCE family protein [Amycolatopsis acididurans]